MSIEIIIMMYYNWHDQYYIHRSFSFLINIFGNLTRNLEVPTTGLVHYCSQYCVTLIIPEGTIEHTATVCFGVTTLLTAILILSMSQLLLNNTIHVIKLLLKKILEVILY